MVWWVRYGGECGISSSGSGVMVSYGGDGGVSSGSKGALTNPRKISQPGDAERFPRAVAKTAVAQICESAGFHSIQLSALETLTDITIRYLCDLGKASQRYANLAGRTQSNALDAVAALEDSAGASFSDLHCPASSSVCVKELIRFVEYGDEMPFAKPLPRFPVRKNPKPSPSFLQCGETPSHPCIPPWLPAFPDPSTYVPSVAIDQSNRDASLDSMEGAKQRHKAELARVSRHLRLCTSGASTSGDNMPPLINNNIASMGTSPPSASRALPSEHPEASKLEPEGLYNKVKSSKRPFAFTPNPFLAPPLPPGAKEVSALFLNDIKPPSPAPNTKKIVALPLPSMLEVFKPALEAASCDVQERCGSLKPVGGIIPSLKERMPVLLTLDFGRRAKGKGVVASLGLGGKGKKRGGIQLDDNDKDEKKKRAEQILAQGLERNDDDAK